MSVEPQGDYNYKVENDFGTIIGYTRYYEEFSYEKLEKIEFD